MTTQASTWQRLLQLEGYLLVPHELLHVAAHRLLGRDYSYAWGETGVDKQEPCTWREDLFCLLFPLAVTLPLALLPFIIWLITFFQAGYTRDEYWVVAPLWHPGLFLLGLLLLTYVLATSLFDLIFAGQILLRQLTDQPPEDPCKDHNER